MTENSDHAMQPQRFQAKNGLFGCPCCGYATVSEPGSYEICPICFWEDDGQDDSLADEELGDPNRVSLTQGRIDYLTFGASDGKDKPHCRLPSECDERLRWFVLEDGRLLERPG